MESIRIIEKNDRYILTLVSDAEGKRQLVKSYAEDHPSLEAMAQLRNELNIGSKLDHEGIRASRGEVFFEKRKCLLLNFIEGKSIRQLAPLDVPEFFRFSIRMTKILIYVHQQGILHRDISSYNILYDETKKEYCLIDFGNAILLPANSPVNQLTGTPGYTSPELTGRLQRKADERSDLYSLGVVFYEMLTGFNPFEDESGMQVIYKHLAKVPESPDHFQPGIPKTLSSICLKLLEKNQDDRYFTATGLLNDLEEALLLYRRNLDPTDFIPGGSEKPPPFHDNPPLVGHQGILETLQGTFQQLLAGNSSLTWLTGPKGIGKTALVQELLGQIHEQQAIYLPISKGPSSKPFSYLFELYEQLLNRIEEEPEDQIIRRKIQFNSDNTTDLGFLAEKIPRLSKFVESKSAETHYSPIQSQNRLQLGFQDLLKNLLVPERPVIAHFMESASMDKESLDFLQDFVRDLHEEFIWIILETREDMSVDQEKRSSGKTLQVSGLKEHETDQLLENMIEGKIQNRETLLKKIKQYGAGNPEKMIELTRYWFKNHFLEFDFERTYWFWNDRTDKALYPDARLYDTQITDPVQRDIIEWVAIFQGQLDLALLLELCDHPREEIRVSLEKLHLQNHLISVRNGNEKEHLKLTADVDLNQLVPDASIRKEKHLRAASILLAGDGDIYQTAYHINSAEISADSGISLSSCLDVNLRAGLQAKQDGAFNMSRNYFSRALNCLDQVDPGQEKLFILYLNSAELAQLEGDHEVAANLFVKAFDQASTDLQKAEIYSRQLTLFNHQGKLDESFASGRKALELLGFPIPARAGKTDLLRKLIVLWLKVGRKDPLKLVDMPNIKEPRVIIALRILEDLHPALFNISSDLLAFVILSSFEKVLRYGNTPEGYSAYAGFGAILALGFNNYSKGWAFTLAGADMTRKFHNKFYQGRGLYSKGAWMINYVDHSKHSVPILEEGIRLSKESGDFSYATYGAMNLIEALFMLGVPLQEFEHKVDEYISFTHQIRYDDILALSLVSKQYILKLGGREEELDALENTWFGGRSLEAYTRESSFKHLRIFYLLLDAFHSYFTGAYAAGMEALIESESLLYTLQGPAIVVDYYFIRALLSYELALAASGSAERKKYEAELAKYEKKLRKYARLVAANYEHRHFILKACRLDLARKAFQARETMREAVASARKHGYVHLEGIASEYLARWFDKMEQQDYARLHSRDAYTSYVRWEAGAVAERMNRLYGQYIPSYSHSGNSASGGRRSGQTASGQFSNLEIIMQSALNVSSETDFEALLDVMNKIFVEQTGATRSLLFIQRESELSLLYEMDQDRKSYYPYPGKAMTGMNNIPKNILQLVLRSQETIHIGDSSKESRFRFERYFKTLPPSSILVVPMIYRGSLSGIIYFENQLLTDAFSTSRQELIGLLSGQFAVALQNAQLVEELEQRVSERTMALESEKNRADLLLKNILPVETAEELKHHGKASSRFYRNVSVMFTDFIGFTRISEKMEPEALVRMLDHYFRAFDKITARYELEKIKTIGDAYLCVAGLPHETSDHAEKALMAAFDILDFIHLPENQELYGLELRIGIHSGPVISGVVGENKFAFDIWGDTVNTASRMESNSQSGKINISQETRNLLKHLDRYNFSYRGKVEAKNKGEIDMYFVTRAGQSRPNVDGAIQFILQKMEKELPYELSYHSIDHTREIMAYAQMIGESEGISADDMDLLMTAAAYHDSGFLLSREHHEMHSCKFTDELLPGYGFSPEQIAQINRMILATQIPQKPEDHLSCILCDADLYYLGTPDFFPTGEKLFREFRTQGLVQDERSWLELQIRFLEGHSYHTDTAKTRCETSKASHLDQLKIQLKAL